MSELSGGQKQRVWIAMALAQDTKVLFLDEPTTYLDIRYQLQILKLIRQLNREYGITIVMVLHDINQSLYYSDEIVAMKDGKMIAHGLPEEIITSELVQGGLRCGSGYPERGRQALCHSGVEWRRPPKADRKEVESRMKQRKTVEDYLKTIYLLQNQNGSVRGVDIAAQLGVSRPTVSISLKALEQEGYLLLDERHEVHLTGYWVRRSPKPPTNGTRPSNPYWKTWAWTGKQRRRTPA